MSEDAIDVVTALDDSGDSHQDFPVVGMGASAGGLEAVTDLLRHLPEAPGMALVLVQHLDPQHETLLPEILERETKLPVRLAEEGMILEKDHVYVIPPNHNLGVEAGRLILSPRESNRALFMPIDHFLRSLAKERGRLTIAVILSGGGTDGSLA
jgi:two-component system CheB/CheR fusion protein